MNSKVSTKTWFHNYAEEKKRCHFIDNVQNLKT